MVRLPSRWQPGRLSRRSILTSGSALGLAGLVAPVMADAFEGDPFKSHQWVAMKQEFLGRGAPVVFDERIKVQGPKFAEDPMNVPVRVQADLPGVQRILVLVDRNPIRKVLELQPLASSPAVSFRFKLEQASPVRAAAQTADGLWHVGGTWVDSAGGGCTVSGGSRADGSWPQTLGQVSARMFRSSAGGDGASRLRMRIMHPMDTGLVDGIPAFYLSKLSVVDGRDHELLRIETFEPVSENPVFSFDFPHAPPAPLRIQGRDNNGNRIVARVD